MQINQAQHSLLFPQPFPTAARPRRNKLDPAPSQSSAALRVRRGLLACQYGPDELGHAGGDLGDLIGAVDICVAGIGAQPV